MKDTFKKNPSKEALKSDLNLIGSIISEQNLGNTIEINEGVVTVVDKNDHKSVTLGTLTDIAALTQELFGDEVPDGVEYMKLGGVTFMTYYGHLIACGDGSQLKDSRVVDLFESINKVLENDITQAIGFVWDIVMIPDAYSNTKKLLLCWRMALTR